MWVEYMLNATRCCNVGFSPIIRLGMAKNFGSAQVSRWLVM